MIEKEWLLRRIKLLEDQIEPLRKDLNRILLEEVKATEERVKLAHRGQGKFLEDELRFSRDSRCPCGAGLAYPKDSGMHGSWDCSDILMGRAAQKDSPDAKEHVSALPFAFYEIKGENDERSTRPGKA